MARVTDCIVSLVAKQARDAGIVVWYDPERTHCRLAEKLALPGTTVLKFDGSFFELRAQLEPLLEFIDSDGHPRQEQTVPPHVLVYVPMDRRETHYALIGFLTLRQAQGERKSGMKSGRGSAHAEPVEAFGGVFQQPAKTSTAFSCMVGKTWAYVWRVVVMPLDCRPSTTD